MDWGDMEETEDPGNDQMEEPLGGDGMNEEYDGRMYEDMRYDDEAQVNLHDSTGYEGLDDVERDMPDDEFEMDAAHNDKLDMMFSADNIADRSSQHNMDEGEKRQIHVMDDTDDMKVLTGENAMEHDVSLTAEKENAPAEMEKLDMAQN